MITNILPSHPSCWVKLSPTVASLVSRMQGEAVARERKLREKELMIAHLQQRAEERRREEELRTNLYDNNLAELEQQEYELILSLQKQRVRANPLPPKDVTPPPPLPQT